MPLAEISKQTNIDHTDLAWFLVIILMLIYNGKEQAGIKETQNAQFEEKGSTRKFTGPKSSAQGDKKFKDICLMLGGIKGMVLSGQAPSR